VGKQVTETAALAAYLVGLDAQTRGSLARALEGLKVRRRTFQNGKKLLETCHGVGVRGCLVMPVQLPRMTAFDVWTAVRKRQGEVPAILLGEAGDVSTAVRALKSGAADYFAAPVAPERVAERVRMVIDNERARLAKRRDVQRLRARMERLTPREAEVLERVVRGSLNKQIARRLRISHKTVEMHRARVMAKLGVRSIAELVHAWCVIRCRNPEACACLEGMNSCERERD